MSLAYLDSLSLDDFRRLILFKNRDIKFPAKLFMLLYYCKKQPNHESDIGCFWENDTLFCTNTKITSNFLHLKPNSLNAQFKNYGFKIVQGNVIHKNNYKFSIRKSNIMQFTESTPYLTILSCSQKILKDLSSSLLSNEMKPNVSSGTSHIPMFFNWITFSEKENEIIKKLLPPTIDFDLSKIDNIERLKTIYGSGKDLLKTIWELMDCEGNRHPWVLPFWKARPVLDSFSWFLMEWGYNGIAFKICSSMTTDLNIVRIDNNYSLCNNDSDKTEIVRKGTIRELLDFLDLNIHDSYNEENSINEFFSCFDSLQTTKNFFE